MFWRKRFPFVAALTLLLAPGAYAEEASSTRDSELLTLAIQERTRELEQEMAGRHSTPEKRLRPLVKGLQRDFGVQNRSHIAVVLAGFFPELQEEILRELLRDRVSDSQALVEALGQTFGGNQSAIVNLPGRIIASPLARARSSPARRLTLPTASSHRRHVSTTGDPGDPTVVSGSGTIDDVAFDLGVATFNEGTNSYTIVIGEQTLHNCILLGGSSSGSTIEYLFFCDPHTITIVCIIE